MQGIFLKKARKKIGIQGGKWYPIRVSKISEVVTYKNYIQEGWNFVDCEGKFSREPSMGGGGVHILNGMAQVVTTNT